MKEKVAEWINVLFGVRKFLLMVVLYVVGIIFRVKGLLSGSEMVDLFKATTIAFMSANGVEYLVAGVKSVMNSKGQSNLADTDESNDEQEVKPVVES